MGRRFDSSIWRLIQFQKFTVFYLLKFLLGWTLHNMAHTRNFSYCDIKGSNGTFYRSHATGRSNIRYIQIDVLMVCCKIAQSGKLTYMPFPYRLHIGLVFILATKSRIKYAAINAIKYHLFFEITLVNTYCIQTEYSILYIAYFRQASNAQISVTCYLFGEKGIEAKGCASRNKFINLIYCVWWKFQVAHIRLCFFCTQIT